MARQVLAELIVAGGAAEVCRHRMALGCNPRIRLATFCEESWSWFRGIRTALHLSGVELSFLTVGRRTLEMTERT